MDWIRSSALAILFLALPTLGLGATNNDSPQTTVEWRQLGEIPSGTFGKRLSQTPGSTGQFVGVHNGALIVAGGANVVSQSGQPDGDRTYSDAVWFATPATPPVREADSESTVDEQAMRREVTELTLPGKRAYGASVSHKLGLIAIGGTDGAMVYSDVFLIRWNDATELTAVLTLPPLPSVSVNGGAAVIGDQLYVVVGSTGDRRTDLMYGFDLSRIQLDSAGNPLSDRGVVAISNKLDEHGRSVSPWQKLPSLPEGATEGPASDGLIVVGQTDGSGDRLYVMSKQRAIFPGGHGAANGVEPRLKLLRQPQEYTDNWKYNPTEKQWGHAAGLRIDDRKIVSSTWAGTALGQSHILLLADSGDGQELNALAYHTITDTWTDYELLSSTHNKPNERRHSDPQSGTATAVQWGEGITLVRSGTADIVATVSQIEVRGAAPNFGWQNMTVLVIYLLSMVMVGVYFAFGNTDTNDYFRGGQRIPWWAAACSIYATLLSSLTFLALPALIYRTNWLLLVGSLMVLLATPIAAYIAMPFFRQIDATSAYEYLSKRFNMSVRLFASGLFTLFHISRIGIVLALTALALAAVTPLDAWQSVIVMGVLSLIYCTLGGISAVIWTDTIQTGVLVIGALTCFGIIIGGIEGGVLGFIDIGMANDKFQMINWDFSRTSITSLSIWAVVLGGFGQHLSSYIADQAIVQRYMTTKDVKAATSSVWMSGIIAIPGAFLFFCIGTGLYSFYQVHPERLDPTIQTDQIFPAFIASEVPVGIAGLIVAGIFAAAQSTVSTSMNSTATTLVTDFMRPFNACRSEHGYLNAARILTVLIGVLGTGVGLLFISPEIRSLMEEYFKVLGMFMGALGGLFILGVGTRRANSWGALIGISIGVGAMVLVWRMGWADGFIFTTIGMLICLVSGYLVSLLLPSDGRDLEGLTLRTMRRVQSE